MRKKRPLRDFTEARNTLTALSQARDSLSDAGPPDHASDVMLSILDRDCNDATHRTPPCLCQAAPCLQTYQEITP